MALKLFNTLTREKEEFEPIEEGRVRFYSCGQTIYDDLHVGNARPYVFWDTLTRYLRWKGYTVRHVQNITDVGHLTDDGDQGEDKVEKRARELGLEPMELVEDQIERYFEDTKAINVNRQDIVPRATGHVNEMISYIKKIIENGYAYERSGNVYFDVDAFVKDYPYGEMAKKDLEQLKSEAESRVEEDDLKKRQYDFALWLSAEDSGHLMSWDSPWSEGYPGWHLECSVMGQKYLGDEFDIHAGGKDHIFPHHPNERAQCFAATGKGLARFWLHNEFVTVEGEKMSKSKGNFYTVRDLLDEGYSGDAIRLYLISSHYRSETDFSKEGLEKAEKELRTVRRTVQRIRNSGTSEILGQEAIELEEEFEELMDDDLDTASAKQSLMKFVKEANSMIDEGKDVSDGAAKTISELFHVLGVEVDIGFNEGVEKLADLMLDLREEYRAREDYETADRIRSILEDAGFEVEDTEDGAEWYKVG